MNNQLYFDPEAYYQGTLTNYYFKSIIVGLYENISSIRSTINTCYLNEAECHQSNSYWLRLFMKPAPGYVMEYE